MALWIFMMIITLITPGVLIIFGRRFMKNPPMEISRTYGYRTKSSMRNMDTWIFAHKYAGKLWFIIGVILLPVVIIAMLIVLGKEENVVGITGIIIIIAEVIPLILGIVLTELALRKNFDESGNPR